MRYLLLTSMFLMLAVMGFGAGVEGHHSTYEEIGSFEENHYQPSEWDGFWNEWIGFAIIQPLYKSIGHVFSYGYQTGLSYQYLPGNAIMKASPIIGLLGAVGQFYSRLTRVWRMA
jgi:hypothetical protein